MSENETQEQSGSRSSPCYPTFKTLEEWMEFACRDDCLDRMVPSDLRWIVSEAMEWKKRATKIVG